METLSVAIDIFFVIVMLIFVFYAAKINAGIQAVKDGKKDMDELMRHFSSAIQKADTSIREIRHHVENSLPVIDERMRDLTFLVRRADELSQRLDQKMNRITDDGRDTFKKMKNTSEIAPPFEPVVEKVMHNTHKIDDKRDRFLKLLREIS